MFSKLLWIAIAVLGLVLYMNPGLLTVEGFEDAAPTATAATTDVKKQQMETLKEQMALLEKIVGSNLPDPDSAGAAGTAANAVGATAQPAEHETTASRPAAARVENFTESPATAQGREFAESSNHAPPPAEEPKVIYKDRYIHVPRRCPKQRPCPNVVCPDMRDYIRKDSIPCWACKLS